MSDLQKGSGGHLNPLLKEGLALAQELFLLEEEIQQSLLSMDFQRLASAVESGAGSLRRGERFIMQKQKVAGKGSLREFIELQPESTERSAQLENCDLLAGSLTAVKAGEEVNRCLVEAGSQLASRMHNVISACKTTYNFRGEPRSSSSGARRGLDQNC